MFTFLVYLVDKVVGFLAHLGLIGLTGLLSQGEWGVVLMCSPLLIVGLLWGLLTVSLTVAPRAYWAFSPLNVMGMKVGGVVYSMISFFLAPMIFLMAIFAV